MNVSREFAIRDMKTEDLSDVLSLERQTFDAPWTAEVFKHELRRRGRMIYLVAHAPGLLAGYMGAQVLGREVHLTNMAVRCELRRRGLGSAMLLECIRRSREGDARWLTLEVREANAAALDFYRRFGFMELGVRVGYYSDTGEDAVIMATGDINGSGFLEAIAYIESGLARGRREESG